MATFTLLQMVQEVLSSLQGDEVNSFADNSESTAVAQIIQRKYYDIATRGELPEHHQLFQLTPSANLNTPVLMFIPTGVQQMEWLKYFDTSLQDGTFTSQFGTYSHDLNVDLVQNQKWLSLSSTSNTVGFGSFSWTVQTGMPVVIGQTAIAVSGTVSMFGNVTSYVGSTITINVTQVSGSGTFNDWVIMSAVANGVEGYKYVTIVPIDQFIDIVNTFNPADTNVQSFQFNQGGQFFSFNYKTDQQPKYCTVIENSYVIFDGYDNSQDNALQASKTMAFGVYIPPFLMQDNFTPDIDDQQFPLLINESIALAWFELRQMANPKAEQELKRQWASVQKNKSVSGKPIPFDQFPYFGRK